MGAFSVVVVVAMYKTPFPFFLIFSFVFFPLFSPLIYLPTYTFYTFPTLFYFPLFHPIPPDTLLLPLISILSANLYLETVPLQNGS